MGAKQLQEQRGLMAEEWEPCGDTGEEWEHVGDIGVDGAMCLIGDPTYFSSEKPTVPPEEFRRQLDAGGCWTWGKVWTLDRDLGVVVTTGSGDGHYPVYVLRDCNGRVAEVRVMFLGQQERERRFCW